MHQHNSTPWRDMDYATKFLVVNRWSLIISPWLVALVFVSVIVDRTPTHDAALWVGVAVAAVSCAAGSLALHTNASLRMRPHSHGKFWLWWGLAGHLAALAVCALLALFGPVSWAAAVFAATGPLFFTTLLAYLPFVPHGAAATALLLAGFGVLSLSSSASIAGPLVLYGAAFALVTPLTKWLSRAMIETERARRLEAQLSSTQERLHLSQDLHDTMGQHLAAMTIKTQLAQALAERDDPRLPAELAELHQLAQTAAADMRHVVHRYRTPDLTTELTAATHVLSDAGANVTVTGTATDVPAALQETAAWFIREAATNILRHSQATKVDIALTPRAITVKNNHPEPSARPGTGLEGLRRRAAEHGARLHSEHTPAWFTVALEVGA